MHGHTNIKFSFSHLESLNQIKGNIMYLVFTAYVSAHFFTEKKISKQNVGLENCKVYFEFSFIEIKWLWWAMGK